MTRTETHYLSIRIPNTPEMRSTVESIYARVASVDPSLQPKNIDDLHLTLFAFGKSDDATAMEQALRDCEKVLREKRLTALFNRVVAYKERNQRKPSKKLVLMLNRHDRVNRALIGFETTCRRILANAGAWFPHIRRSLQAGITLYKAEPVDWEQFEAVVTPFRSAALETMQIMPLKGSRAQGNSEAGPSI